MRVAIVAACLSLGACHLSNEEIIAEVRRCEAAGLDADLVMNHLDMSITRVNCALPAPLPPCPAIEPEGWPEIAPPSAEVEL